MTRKSVVLPEPEGPSSAISSPERIRRPTPRNAAVSPKSLTISATVMSTESVLSMGGSARDFVAVAPLEDRFDRQGDEGETSEERSDGEGCHEVEFIVQDLDMEGHGRGEAAQ